ncbi:MAG: cytidylate kinase family protein [Candidatus Pacebacteria bacterium]|jgi:cytidylate kinase|nr:cytidylate kinase family protein [Candidatus Paceibacterota bacterium]
MKRQHIITISGKPGSGKSSTADIVAELLGYTRHSSGDMVRQILAEKGMSLAEYNERARNDHALDEAVDERLRELRTKKDIVVDSRLGFYWIPESFKVYLDLDIEVATVRIYTDAVSNATRSGTGEGVSSLTEVTKQVRTRMEGERARFRALYHVDPYEMSHFDLIVDTSRHSPQTVALTVYDSYRKWLQTEVWKQERSAIPAGYSFKNQY